MRWIVFLMVLSILVIMLYLQRAPTLLSTMKKNYKVFLSKQDEFLSQLNEEEHEQHIPDFLDDQTAYIDHGKVSLQYVLSLFYKYPNVNYVIHCNCKNYNSDDPKDILRFVGDSFITLLYNTQEECFDSEFAIFQRSVFAMQVLVNNIFFNISFLDIMLNRLKNDNNRLINNNNYKRSYMTFIFIDRVQTNKRKYIMTDRFVNRDAISIIQTWVSRDTDCLYLAQSSDAVKRDYPTCNYTIFDDWDMKQFIRQHYPQKVVDRYDLILPSAFKSDFFRYLYLYQNGGFYFDISLMSQHPITKFIGIEDYDFISPIDMGSKSTEQLYQAFMYVRKGHPYLKGCIDEIMNYKLDQTPILSCLRYTGPQLIGSIVTSSKTPSRNLFLRHADGNRIILEMGQKDYVIMHTKGKYPKQAIGKDMYKESQKNHYSKHCVLNTIFYN